MSRQEGDLVSIAPVEGGVTAAGGFRAAGVACGIKKTGALDLALIVPDRLASAAGVFTTNLAQAAPVVLSRGHLARSSGRAAAVIVNSGCANACTGERGFEVARGSAAVVAEAIGCRVDQVLVASTGVIGVDLPLERLAAGVRLALPGLARQAHLDAARAIMTTDPFPKETAVRVTTGRGSFCVGGMAKGSGMIEPNMATMLGVITTDAEVEPGLFQRALLEAVAVTFNAITVDGECSTNDTVFALASGASGIHVDQESLPALVAGLKAACGVLAREIVRGGEGATKLVSVTVSGAQSVEEARRAARAIANSLLVKTAIHGGDPNWGRLVAVAGRAGVAFDLEHTVVRIGPVTLFSHGQPHDDRAPEAAAHLSGKDIQIALDLGAGGTEEATIWTCDLSADYVKINAEYRT
jgi:glutamate N-acetyltransferase/amino-acid N-acetyltransferase